jgi:hypothetical protein
MLAASSLIVALAAPALAQSQSLADLARRERIRKGKDSPGGKVFTNEDIPAPTISSTPAQQSPAEAAEGAEAQKAASESATTGTAEGQPSQEDLEKQYREKFAKLKEDLDLQERKLDVLQRELNLMQQQHYSDPNMALQQEYTRENINKRTEEIEAQKQAVDKSKQAIADLETELQRKGLPPGWAR